MKKWIIVDWMSVRCFTDHAFKTYEDAWNFLYETFPGEDREDELRCYCVVKINIPHYTRLGKLPKLFFK